MSEATSLAPEPLEKRPAGGSIEDDLATRCILAVHKLVKYSLLYHEENEAIRKQLDIAIASVAEFGKRTGKNLKVFFSPRSVWVGNALLRAPRSVYETALELGKLFKRYGINEMAIGYDVPIDDFRALQQAVRDARANGTSPSEGRYLRIRLRTGSEPFRGPAHLQDKNLGDAGKLIRAYVTSIVIMRRFFERVQKGNYSMPARVRRVAQQLAELEAVQMPTFLAATTLRNAASDNASQAVHAALLVLGMGRLITGDALLLMRMAMATLLYDTGKPRVAGDDPFGDARMGGMMPRLGEEQFQELPAATAAMSIIMSGLNEAANFYSVLCYEAWHVRYPQHCQKPYQDERGVSLESRLVAYARFFTELLASEEETYTPDSAFAVLSKHAKEPVDRAVLRLLLAAIGLFPTGALVLLSTGETAQVVRVHDDAKHFTRPVVQVLVDARGTRAAQGRELDLAAEGMPTISRLLSIGEDKQAGAPIMSLAPVASRPVVTSVAPLAGRTAPPARAAETVPPASNPGSSKPLARVALTRLTPQVDPLELMRQQSLPTLEPLVRQEAAPPETSDGADPMTMVASAGNLPRPSQPARPSAAPVASSRPPADPVARARQIVGQRLRPLKPTSHGGFQTTSLATVLFQCHAEGFGGSALLIAPDGGLHCIYFEAGTPAKVLTTAPVAPLDELLTEMGMCDAETLAWSVAEARKTGELHGQLLLRHQRIDYDGLLEALSWQLRRKLFALHQLPVATRYALYQGTDALDEYGGSELTPYEAAALALDGLRSRPDDPAIEETAVRIGSSSIYIRPGADLAPLELQPDEAAVAEALRHPYSVSQLCESGIADEAVVKAVVHALAMLGLLA